MDELKLTATQKGITREAHFLPSKTCKMLLWFYRVNAVWWILTPYHFCIRVCVTRSILPHGIATQTAFERTLNSVASQMFCVNNCLMLK